MRASSKHTVTRWNYFNFSFQFYTLIIATFLFAFHVNFVICSLCFDDITTLSTFQYRKVNQNSTETNRRQIGEIENCLRNSAFSSIQFDSEKSHKIRDFHSLYFFSINDYTKETNTNIKILKIIHIKHFFSTKLLPPPRISNSFVFHRARWFDFCPECQELLVFRII